MMEWPQRCAGAILSTTRNRLRYRPCPQPALIRSGGPACGSLTCSNARHHAPSRAPLHPHCSDSPFMTRLPACPRRSAPPAPHLITQSDPCICAPAQAARQNAPTTRQQSRPAARQPGNRLSAGVCPGLFKISAGNNRFRLSAMLSSSYTCAGVQHGKPTAHALHICNHPSSDCRSSSPENALQAKI
jgi:hypothetical protein